MGPSVANAAGSFSIMPILIVIVAAAVLAFLAARLLRRPRLFIIAFIGFIVIGLVLLAFFLPSSSKSARSDMRAAPAVSQSESLNSDNTEDGNGPVSPEPTELPDEY